MKKKVFEGAATAIITPFFENGEIDFEGFGRLIDCQIESGIDAIVAAGTTGEGSTLTDEEHQAVIKFCVEHTAHRVPVIAGTGSNDTDYAKELTVAACEMGADAVLLVTPYYNKATQAGLIKSFSDIADVSNKPCILYNVPSRTGCNILPKTVAELAEHPNIVGIKEASGNISQIAETASLTDDDFSIYSGNDDQIVPVMSLGGSGVISVLSNLLPKETSRMCKLCLKGDYKTAAKMQLEYLPLISALFSEVNPIPVKAAVAAMGYGSNTLRLPLTQIESIHKENLFTQMKKYGVKFKEENL
ncbi:MAG: 4-hydroxy-tetrahydrodipicolinate synthase [Clostridia bacterium]|nr:4-hydroxy-tetrahydrodipicolinate synthase [Clostridia bacterium]